MNIESDPEGSRGEEVMSCGGDESNDSKEWGMSSYKSVVTGDLLVSWRAKYDISSSVIMIIPNPSDHADPFPMGCVVLNLAILYVGLRLPIFRAICKFPSFWVTAPAQLCPNGWRTLIAAFILWKGIQNLCRSI